MQLTGKSGQVLRIVVAVVTALVAGLNSYLGGHWSVADVLGIVIPLAALILAEAHVEGSKAVNSQEQLMLVLERLPGLLQEIVTGLQAAQSSSQGQQAGAGQSPAPQQQAQPPGDGQAAS